MTEYRWQITDEKFLVRGERWRVETVSVFLSTPSASLVAPVSGGQSEYRVQMTEYRVQVKGERLLVTDERGGLFPGPSVLQTGRFYPPPPLRSSHLSQGDKVSTEYRWQITDDRLQMTDDRLQMKSYRWEVRDERWREERKGRDLKKKGTK